MINRLVVLSIASVLMVSVLGCATTSQTVTQVNKLRSLDGKARILLMEPDVKYYLLTTGGLPEPNAEWTEVARRNFLNALTGYAKERNADVVVLDDADADDDLVVQYDKLHGAVGSTILINHFGGAPLPAKAGRFDWGLGPQVSALGDVYQADYALFSFYRDYQASGGRVAFAILAAAAGIAVPATAEFGFASLVDLQTGEIVWFNNVTVGAGELRDSSGARAVIEGLFRGMPQG